MSAQRPFLAGMNAQLLARGLLGLGIVGADGQIILREGTIASWMPLPGRSVGECPLLAPLRDDLAALTPTSDPIVIPDFTMAGAAHLGKLTVTLAALTDPAGSVVVLTSLARRDGTTEQTARTKVREQDMIEERMLAATREIERMNRQLEQFASVTAHDLQAPVRQIGSLLGFLRGEVGETLTPMAQTLLANVDEVLARMRSQIDGLYEYSRTASQPLHREPFDLSDAVKEALANLADEVRRSRAEVSVTALPTFNASRALMISVFQNLIGNAIKYAGDQPPRIAIACEELSDRHSITVTDNGPGIDPQHSETVFKLFSRGYPRVSADGIGIGLALTRQIVARHGGSIHHDAAFTEGTRMVMELPKPRAQRG